MSRPGMIQRALAANRQISARIEKRLPHARALWPVYDQTVADLVNARVGQLVLDVGAGKSLSFAGLIQNRDRTTIVGVDVSAEALDENPDLDRRLVADASRELPLAAGSVDVLASRTTLEHLPDVGAFFDQCSRVLRPGGSMVHVYSCRFAPFAILNRLLPSTVSRAALMALKPESAEECGFHAYYNDCYHSAIERVAARSGFELTHVRPSYYQSWYFESFVPLYLASAAYELAVRAVGATDLAAYLLIVARKR